MHFGALFSEKYKPTHSSLFLSFSKRGPALGAWMTGYPSDRIRKKKNSEVVWIPAVFRRGWRTLFTVMIICYQKMSSKCYARWLTYLPYFHDRFQGRKVAKKTGEPSFARKMGEIGTCLKRFQFNSPF